MAKRIVKRASTAARSARTTPRQAPKKKRSVAETRSITQLKRDLRARTRELTEALEQQTATSQVLSVISSSPGELEPVFRAMLEKAVRICKARFGILYRFENGAFEPGAMLNA